VCCLGRLHGRCISVPAGEHAVEMYMCKHILFCQCVSGSALSTILRVPFLLPSGVQVELFFMRAWNIML
jgi:hypothetical protein